MTTPINPYVPSDLAAPTPLELQLAAAQRAADRVTADGTQSLQQLIRTIQRDWRLVWAPAQIAGQSQYTSAQVLAALGPAAKEVFRTAAIITAAVAEIQAGLPSPATLLETQYLSAGQPYVAHDDGTVVLASN